jgi:hypothetical protein
MSKTYTLANLNFSAANRANVDFVANCQDSIEDYMPVGAVYTTRYCADTGSYEITITRGEISAEDLADLQAELELMPQAFVA